MQKVTILYLKEKINQVKTQLQNLGLFCDIVPCFEYGAYSYYIKWGATPDKLNHQHYTGFGTKAECWEKLDKAFYIIYYQYMQEVGA